MYDVLLVDDEPITKIAIRKLLANDSSDSEFELIGTASNGVEALQFVKENNPDIILTDLIMPQMDGLELIHNLNSNGYNGSILVFSNYSDFDLVREALLAGAIDYMLKVNVTTDSLNYYLHKAADKIQERQRLFKKEAEHHQVLQQNKALKRTSMLKELFYSLNTHSKYDVSEDLEGDAEWKKNTYLIDILFIEQSTTRKWEHIPLKGISELLLSIFEQYSPTIVTLNSNEILCMFSEPSESINKICRQDKAEQIIRQTEMYYNIAAIVFLPERVKGIKQVINKYLLCRNKHHVIFYCQDHSSILYPEEMIVSSLPETWNSKITASKLITLQGNGAHMERYIKTLLDECSTRNVKPENLRKFFIQVIECIYIALDFTYESNQQEALGKQLNSSSTIHELKASLITVLDDILSHMLPLKYQTVKSDVKKSLLYIHGHYHEKITLEDISQSVNLNPSYLSRTFKKELNENIFHYINGLRMEKALKLMNKKDIYIKEIAIQVGIDDQFYFAKLFKKYYGISPSEYISGL